MKDDIFVLGIESSCDETAASVVKNGRCVLSNVICSQIDIHKKFGGVVPEIASRNHVEKIDEVVYEAIKKSGKDIEEIDVIAATYGPGLVGALLVGLSFGKSLAYALNKPFIGVHHIEGHIYANFLENTELTPPFMCLIVSGGHTQLTYIKDYGKYEVLGKTRDDAAGEAYDKIARAIGLGYPGGVQIDNLAKKGDFRAIQFPRAMLKSDDYDFSFSGLKSAVLNYINTCKMTKTPYLNEDLAASFQASVSETLVYKSMSACRNKNVKTLAIAGGVAANSELRRQMQEACNENGIKLYMPSIPLCTDNAAMIASCGYYSYLSGNEFDLGLNAYPNLSLES